ncbi:PREDICTED: probable F-box protein At4g22030 [Nelumbo nucifera]|uniref:Probable F-box protein At4g22030 n=1 Tax=Nelumbo nucifera TaxID=4432 RepID=A0A1U8AQ52_NELNU|nr:PREDICTED: probable F-box protein At4g22030 [Nelumbo nucifera]
MVAAADRAEMHANIQEQRNNWNHLLLTSINTITITAATMVGPAETAGTGAPLAALKLSSTLLYTAAIGMLPVMSKIQPSQLVEEQRNAARLFKQLHGQIRTTLTLGSPSPMDPWSLPCGGHNKVNYENKTWVEEEKEMDGTESWKEEMKQIVAVLKRKDIEEYLRLGKIALKVNRVLAISGPLHTGLAAVGSQDEEHGEVMDRRN